MSDEETAQNDTSAIYGTFSDDLTGAYGDAPSWGWDYVLVFPARRQAIPETPDPFQTSVDSIRTSILSSLRDASFSYSQLWLPSDGLVLVRISLSEDAFFEKAAHDRIRLKLLPRYGGGYLSFEPDRAHVFENTLRKEKGLPYFSPAARVQLILIALRSREEWGAGLRIDTLKKEGILKQAFATHAHPEQETLLQNAVFNRWWSPWLIMPLEQLKDYFGSRVTIYLAWLAFYARMLLGIAALSVPVYMVLRATDSPEIDAWTRLLWGLCLCFWGAYWLEYWKRRNAVLNVKWGLDTFYEESENDLQPNFTGVDKQGFYCRGGFVNLEDLDPEKAASGQFDREGQPGLRSRIRGQVLEATGIISRDELDRGNVLRIGGGDDPDFLLEAPITGLTFPDLPVFPYSSKRKLRNRIYISSLITLFFALCVGACTFVILFFKPEIIAVFGPSFGKFVPGIMTALLISFSDSLWKAFSIRLTKWENNRTAQAYENSLITKRFAFQFVSNYVSLYYIALVKPFKTGDPCMLDVSGTPDCMAELGTQLTSLVITKATVQQIIEIGVPFIKFRLKQWQQRREQRQLLEEIDSQQRIRLLAAGATIDDADHKQSIEESHMAPYSSTIEDYGELVIQHGFLVLFGLAFPLAALINLINNMIESRTDTYKMLAVQQRPDADDAADIGGWLPVLKFLSTASVMTTAALVTITTPALQRALPDVIGDTAEHYPAVSFLIFEHILLWIRWGVSFLVSDKPASTYRMVARQEFLIARCFNVGWKPFFRGRPARTKGESA